MAKSKDESKLEERPRPTPPPADPDSVDPLLRDYIKKGWGDKPTETKRK